MPIYYPEKAAFNQNFNQQILHEHLLFLSAIFILPGRFYLSEGTRRYLTGSVKFRKNYFSCKKSTRSGRIWGCSNTTTARCQPFSCNKKKFRVVSLFLKYFWLSFVTVLTLGSFVCCEEKWNYSYFVLFYSSCLQQLAFSCSSVTIISKNQNFTDRTHQFYRGL